MTKEEFNKLWKDSTKEQILNQYYYDYEEMIKSHNIIKEAIEYIKAGKTFDNEDTRKAVEYLQNNLLDILKESDKK